MRIIVKHRENKPPKVGMSLAVEYEDREWSSPRETNLYFRIQYVHTTYKHHCGAWWESDCTVQPVLDGMDLT